MLKNIKSKRQSESKTISNVNKHGNLNIANRDIHYKPEL